MKRSNPLTLTAVRYFVYHYHIVTGRGKLMRAWISKLCTFYAVRIVAMKVIWALSFCDLNIKSVNYGNNGAFTKKVEYGRLNSCLNFRQNATAYIAD